MGKKKKRKQRTFSRRISGRIGIAGLVLIALLSLLGNWYVHHSRSWLAAKENSWPKIVTAPLLWFGNPVADVTDGLGLTGHDAVYEYDEEAPVNSITLAGVPKRIAEPAPDDIRIIDRGEFKIGWSDKLRHPAWCAYHVICEAKFEDDKRPCFLVDKEIATAPKPNHYTNSGYDRGHMVPNHAIVSRYGTSEQRKTFMMSNIAPQSAALNRGVWRDLEHRIADFWTARYGEIWVIVGSVPSANEIKMKTSQVDVPDAYFQLILAQEGLNIRALAIMIPQNIGWNAWAARYILTIDELEKLTGYDFNSELPSFIQDPLEAELPTRLWPVRFRDIFRQILLRFM